MTLKYVSAWQVRICGFENLSQSFRFFPFLSESFRTFPYLSQSFPIFPYLSLFFPDRVLRAGKTEVNLP